MNPAPASPWTARFLGSGPGRFLTGRRPLGRRTFLAWCITLVLIRYNVDRSVAWQAGSQGWSIIDTRTIYAYLFEAWLLTDPDLAGAYWPRLAAVALPTLALGLMLTLGRIRDAGLHPVWAVLSLVPGVKLVFFAILAGVPSKETVAAAGTEATRPMGKLDRWLPRSRWGCALAAALASGGLALIPILASTKLFQSYGWGLFIITPYGLGMISAGLYAYRHPLGRKEAALVASMSVSVAGALLFGLAIEGVICLAMAAPFAFILAILGAATVRVVLEATGRRRDDRMMCIALLAAPLMTAGEVVLGPVPFRFTVSTEVHIAAPPEIVWPLIVDVPELPPAHDLWSRVGIATFRRAWTKGEGEGRVRYCEFDTGIAREPVVRWEPPHRLDLRVEYTPPAMEEWTFYRHIHPEHLDGFYQVDAASFELDPVAGGTLLRGTTVYRHGLHPAWYWAWWSDRIVRDLQRRVLAETKLRAESAAARPVPLGRDLVP